MVYIEHQMSPYFLEATYEEMANLQMDVTWTVL